MMGQFNTDPSSMESYMDSMIKLETGQRLLIYTDGLMEEKNRAGTSFEEKFKRDVIPNLKGLGVNETYELIKSRFEDHLDGKAPDDDVSFILIGARPAGKYETDEFVPGPQLLTNMKDRLLNIYPQKYINKQISNLKPVDTDENSNGTVINDVPEAYASIIKLLSAAGWPQKRINEMGIALREIVTNSFLHGNLCSNRYLVSISHILHYDVLEVCISDMGIGFDGSTVPQSIKELDLLNESGRGLYMADRYADRIFFNDSGNRCWMLFSKN
jgi:anti-sigma regulatory factor (Ser/Thr protein kinase)